MLMLNLHHSFFSRGRLHAAPELSAAEEGKQREAAVLARCSPEEAPTPRMMRVLAFAFNDNATDLCIALTSLCTTRTIRFALTEGHAAM
tara:strand:+ start:237 stop:503 length:267 start_codon:yes stop_codon:yes gene_type:complete